MTSNLLTERRRPKKKRKRKKDEGRKPAKSKKPKKPKRPTKAKPKPTPTPAKPTPAPKPSPASPYAPGSFPATPVLATAARHLVNRFSYGITPALTAEVRAAGGHLAWFDKQLERTPSADPYAEWWPDLTLDAKTMYQRQVDQVRGTWEVSYDIGRRTMMRRICSTDQVLEVMTEFWENHLHVPTNVDNIAVYRAAYGEVVRAGALGRFADLLPATVLHPAMLWYLGNTSSTKKHPNENLGRELLELHTVGVGHHTEDDVKSSARILTGYRAKTYGTWEPYYSATDHWTGTVTVKEFTDPNTATDGRDLTLRYLTFLARHPDTARRIATKLVRQFVTDNPPTALVDKLAAVYLAHDTAIKPVLKALVRSTEFAASVDTRLRDADEDVAATYRILGSVPQRPASGNSSANQLYWQVGTLGLNPFTWPRPDGQPVRNTAWASPTRALASLSLHWNMAGGWWPKAEMTYRAPTTYLPTAKLTFRDLVDHLARVFHQRPSSEALLKACCLAAEQSPTTVVTATSDVFTWRWPRLCAVFLDSPDFYYH
ncbi:DUF1800 domain-containing protein [Nocardioides lianchengensis]|uniref:DUF1800 domain-containing protein n=1 Tax=Nocardioides lianchengensis TaxID=1045774 RepID=A0A1G6XLU6_9ACTN|nr:DUF1800 domain-containing protein [Nocardioides lianchengensis]NYG13359.1 uncharacterized protein (DUF1800 family) [Nocardioides lianchengensis]SDD79120.1 Protein of unknown function [Nocardioides lianchengensis]